MDKGQFVAQTDILSGPYRVGFIGEIQTNRATLISFKTTRTYISKSPKGLTKPSHTGGVPPQHVL